LSSINFKAVEAPTIPPIHPLAESAVVGVAVVVGVVGGVGVTGGFLVGAIHSSFLPFDGLIIAESCYEIKYKIVTILLNRRAGP
jgi:hypothetical protein